MKVKARKSQERKALKLKVHDGSVVGLVHITIKRKDMYDDFTEEVAIALGCDNLFCVQEETLDASEKEKSEVFKLMSDALKPKNNYKVILSLNSKERYYYGILVEGKFYLFYCYYESDMDAINKKLAKPKVNTYSPDYLMQHIEPKIMELAKYGLVTKDMEYKLSLTKTLRRIRNSQAKVLSFKKKLHKGRVQL